MVALRKEEEEASPNTDSPVHEMRSGLCCYASRDCHNRLIIVFSSILFLLLFEHIRFHRLCRRRRRRQRKWVSTWVRQTTGSYFHSTTIHTHRHTQAHLSDSHTTLCRDVSTRAADYHPSFAWCRECAHRSQNDNLIASNSWIDRPGVNVVCTSNGMRQQRQHQPNTLWFIFRSTKYGVCTAHTHTYMFIAFRFSSG